MARVVIVGAGLTGLSVAYHLEKAGFTDYLLLEKEDDYGGLCRSMQQDGFTFDYTGHLLHASDPYFYELITDVVGLDTLNTITRRSFIYSHKTYTHYPFQINLHGLPTDIIVECIMEYIKRPSIEKPATFKDWVATSFGVGLGNHFFYPYQEKIFAHPIDKITASWTGRFVPATSLEEILRGSLQSITTDIGYNARFLYPKEGGIISWITRLSQQLAQPIYTNYCVKKVDMTSKVVHLTNGVTIPYTTLITTIPLDILLATLKEKPSLSLKSAQQSLKCNKVITFNLGLNKNNISDKHWIYFPEKTYPFYRIGFWHNFSATMTPPDMSSLYGECAYMHASAQSINQMIKRSIQQCKTLFDFTDTDIVTKKIVTINHAYVTYDHWREQHLSSLLNRLAQEQIISIGRYGAWKYASMQEALLDGKAAAESILNQYKDTNYLFTSHSQPQKVAHE